MKKLFLVLTVASIVVACSSGDNPVANNDAQVVNVEVGGSNGNLFVPGQLRIKVGQTVRWTWKGGEHNVVSGTGCKNDDKFRSGAPQGTGTFERKFNLAGTFPYFCEPHCDMNMKGEVIVE